MLLYIGNKKVTLIYCLFHFMQVPVPKFEWPHPGFSSVDSIMQMTTTFTLGNNYFEIYEKTAVELNVSNKSPCF